MAGVRFEDLAMSYVLADDSAEESIIACQAAEALEGAANLRQALGLWVASINRWINQGDDDTGDDNRVTRARALGFLAATLGILETRLVVFRPEQTKLLVAFFGSLFSSDHRAGIAASAKALKHIVRRQHLQPLLGYEIMQNICKLGDDFKLQTPSTRHEIYTVFLVLLQNPSIAHDLEFEHGTPCGFMIGILEFCRNERDPANLMKWFEILQIFLQKFSPPEDVTSEIFKTFSAYFPISLRDSNTPSGVTVDNLKGAVRSCFAAHHRLASLSIPYLVAKLDQGDAVTVAVKVDILQTLEACIAKYEDPKHSIIPHVSKIWGSLKYEVRNGEIQDAVKATLGVIRAMTKRIGDEGDLRSFLSDAWRDLEEDLSDQTYTAGASQLLIAIISASAQSFAAIVPQALSHIQTTIKHSNSVRHREELLKVLSSLLTVRSDMLANHTQASETGKATITGPLKDEMFGDKLFHEVFLPFWQDYSSEVGGQEQLHLLKVIMDGVAGLVGQRSSGPEPLTRLCSDATCEHIFQLLGDVAVACPLEGRSPVESVADDDTIWDIRDAATAALKKAVPQYPPAFQQLLLQFFSSITSGFTVLDEREFDPDEQTGFAYEIQFVASSLSEISYTGLVDFTMPLSTHMKLVHVLLDGLFWMMSRGAAPEYWMAFISSMHLSLDKALDFVAKQGKHSRFSKFFSITKNWFAGFVRQVEDNGDPETVMFQPDSVEEMITTLDALHVDKVDSLRQMLAYYLWVVQKIYHRFTMVFHRNSRYMNGPLAVGLMDDLKKFGEIHAKQDNNHVQQDIDICLHQIGQLAASVVGSLTESEQIALQLDKDIFVLFHRYPELEDVLDNETQLTGTGLSWQDDYRTAPLSLGILRGLYPRAITPKYHIKAMKELWKELVTVPPYGPETIRATLDALLATFANKIRMSEMPLKLLNTHLQGQMMHNFNRIMNSHAQGGDPDIHTSLGLFRSMLHFLAGDIARYQQWDNRLLGMITDMAPREVAMGRQLAQCFELLVHPKEYIDPKNPKNHANFKELSGQWVYLRVVKYLLIFGIFPQPNDAESQRRSTNRAVACFAVLKHLNYAQYADGSRLILRAGLVSLNTFKIGVEMESVLIVLLEMLRHDSEELESHLTTFVPRMIAVYEMARMVGETKEHIPDPTVLAARGRDPIKCRRLTLEIFGQIPLRFDAFRLVTYSGDIRRVLAAAKGDPVREIRQAALKAQEIWTANVG